MKMTRNYKIRVHQKTDCLTEVITKCKYVHVSKIEKYNND